MPTSSFERSTLNRSPAATATGQVRIGGLQGLLVTTLLLCTATGPALAAELLYVYSPDCPACRKFDAEVGRIYPRTPEAQRMPMRRVLFSEWQAGRIADTACAARPVVGTPTFLLINDCAELERITGYSTDEGFWMGVARMLRIVDTRSPQQAPETPP
jgi:hypothetical protein